MAYEGQMNPRTFHVPRKKQTFRPEAIGAGKKWQKLFAKPGAIQSMFFLVAQDEADSLLGLSGGASIQRTCEDDRDVAGTIHLAFWRRGLPDGESEEANRDARRCLTMLIDSVFETTVGLQGWIARWDWIPRFTMAEENNYTPYEEAYAMGSPSAEPEDGSGDYMDEQWCRRHLRGLSERIWLGQPLLERINRNRLAAIAAVTDLGPSSARFDLLPGVELRRLEESLIPILLLSRD
jgi:hypothetical protein